MSRSSFFVINLYFCVLTCSYAATILADGTIIEIETLEPKKANPIKINRESNIFPGGRVQAGRTQYQTIVNGQPVTIEIIRDGQMNRYGQMGQNPNYWQQMQKQNQYPNLNQGGLIVTKEKSPFPNIEVYDVYTTGGTNNNRYPNQYINKYPNNAPSYPNANTNNNRFPTGQPIYPNWVPYPNGNRYPNDNIHSYPNQNQPNYDLNQNTKGMNINQETINLSELNNNQNQQNNKDTEHSKGDVKDNDKNNVAGYIDKFPVILLNENEIRR